MFGIDAAIYVYCTYVFVENKNLKPERCVLCMYLQIANIMEAWKLADKRLNLRKNRVSMVLGQDFTLYRLVSYQISYIMRFNFIIEYFVNCDEIY